MNAATTFPRCRPATADRRYGNYTVVKRRREDLREFAARLSDDPELKGCGCQISKGRVGSATEILVITKSCKRKWPCPICGYAASRREAAKLERRLLGWTGQGHAVAFLTLTQSHGLNDGLATLWDRMEDRWAALKRGSRWTAYKRVYGVCGYIRITEVLYSPVTGWHVHYHVIQLLDHELDRLAMDGLKASLAERFDRGVDPRGGGAAPAGQDLRPMTPGTEGALANYLFKGTTIHRSNDGSLTPMALLDHLESTGEGLEQWDEFTAAVSADRRVQVITSRGIDSLCTGTGHYS